MNDNSELTARQKIEAGQWVNCRLCETIFKRKRGTLRYCYHCGIAFCEGEHGTFEGKGIGVCVRCYKLK